MAEERLIDTDKDKKYRFRINENGEEELVIDDGLTEEDESAEEISFEVPEDDVDDEEAAVMTPEQLAERRRREEIRLREQEERITSLMSAAREDMEAGNYATALENVLAAEELSPEDGEIRALELLVYTRGFTSYEGTLDKSAQAAEGVREYSSQERRAELFAMAKDGLSAEISQLTERVEKLSAENQAKKAERAVRFDADNKKAALRFICTAVPFVVLIALAIVFSTLMFADESGMYVVLTIVFGCLAFVNLIVLAFAARFWNIAARRVRMNKNDSKTRLGREYIAEKDKLEKFTAIYDALKD